MSEIYRRKDAFYRKLARTILFDKYKLTISEKILERFAGASNVQAEIELISEDFLKLWNNYKESATTEVVKPTQDMANEDTEPVSSLSLDASADSSLSEKVINDPALPPEEKNNGNPPTVSLAKGTKKPMTKPQARFRLVNATVGRDYADELGVECPANILVTQITGQSGTGLSDVGLEYDPKEATVKGSPTKPGEFKLSAQYRLKADPDGGTWSQDFTFIVNPDPRSLWKDMASDRSVPFWKADNESQGKVGQEPWMLAVASRRGRSHAHAGKHRDDDFCLISGNSNGWHILAVSDGAGSAQFSREGARIAVECASNTLAVEINKSGIQLEEAIIKWQQGRADETDEREKALKQSLYGAFRLAVYEPAREIDKLARARGDTYRDFYATLLLCAHKTIGNQQFVAGYWIGDGALAIYAEGEYIKLLGESDGGEYAGQTRFLDPSAVSSQENIMQRICFGSRPEISAVFLMTDGVSDPKFETDANLQKQDKWDDLWKEIKPQLDQDPEKTSMNLLDWLGFWSPGNHDDRTLAVLYQHAPVPIQP
uniref:Serine/threonine protein phosphatase PrpC n=1 Tax=Candidatus Kentrum sp. MB TaxID=2138164 RepID=A0A451B963_9GAMM|nr:MAG: Serine/threonine protein phosphatase PrpC [Candidatus Kentron sp. MB]VFK74836.1 MAG: Serine/threonine protein phosphatase PrpC [Candidatus Kentron sp. MB]